MEVKWTHHNKNIISDPYCLPDLELGFFKNRLLNRSLGKWFIVQRSLIINKLCQPCFMLYVMFLQHLHDRIILDKVTESDNLFEDNSTKFPTYQKYNYDNGYKGKD